MELDYVIKVFNDSVNHRAYLEVASVKNNQLGVFHGAHEHDMQELAKIFTNVKVGSLTYHAAQLPQGCILESVYFNNGKVSSLQFVVEPRSWTLNFKGDVFTTELPRIRFLIHGPTNVKVFFMVNHKGKMVAVPAFLPNVSSDNADLCWGDNKPLPVNQSVNVAHVVEMMCDILSTSQFVHSTGIQLTLPEIKDKLVSESYKNYKPFKQRMNHEAKSYR